MFKKIYERLGQGQTERLVSKEMLVQYIFSKLGDPISLASLEDNPEDVDFSFRLWLELSKIINTQSLQYSYKHQQITGEVLVEKPREYLTQTLANAFIRRLPIGQSYTLELPVTLICHQPNIHEPIVAWIAVSVIRKSNVSWKVASIKTIKHEVTEAD